MARFVAVEQDDGTFALVLGAKVLSSGYDRTGLLQEAVRLMNIDDHLYADYADGRTERITREIQRLRARPRRRGWRQ